MRCCAFFKTKQFRHENTRLCLIQIKDGIILLSCRPADKTYQRGFPGQDSSVKRRHLAVQSSCPLYPESGQRNKQQSVGLQSQLALLDGCSGTEGLISVLMKFRQVVLVRRPWLRHVSQTYASVPPLGPGTRVRATREHTTCSNKQILQTIIAVAHPKATETSSTAFRSMLSETLQ